MADAVSVFAQHAHEYHAQRRRLVPVLDAFYGTAVELLALRPGPIERVLDLGAGSGLMSEAVAARYPDAQLVLVDGAAEMLEQARATLASRRASFVCADLRAQLPAGPFDAVVSALAIHHLEHADKRRLFERVHAALRPGGTFVNAEHVAGPTPWLEQTYRQLWRQACVAASASQAEITAAQRRMEMDVSLDISTQLRWMAQAGLEECDCFFKQLHFAVLAGWRPRELDCSDDRARASANRR